MHSIAWKKAYNITKLTIKLLNINNVWYRNKIGLLHVDLHWLDFPERVQYKLGVTVRRCQQHKAPQYLIVTPASDIASRQRLRSASRHQLLVPRYRLSSLGRRSFAVTGPTTWNSLSADLRDPTCSARVFQTFIEKHSCSLSTSVSSALEVFLRRCDLPIYLYSSKVSR